MAFLAFDALQPSNFATASRAGAAPFNLAAAEADIKAARAAGADFVIVMPHWGAEYSEYVSPEQRRDAAALVAAGADLILGSHSHFTGRSRRSTDRRAVPRSWTTRSATCYST